MQNKIAVLYFHSIAPFQHPQWVNSFLSLNLEFFEALIEKLARLRYHFLHLDEYRDIRASGRPKKGNYICLTFDDGYLDNYVFVYPILKKYGAKGTIFVNPSMVQKVHIARQCLLDSAVQGAAPRSLDFLGYCNWEELAIMQRSGVMDIQSHTMTHTKVFCGDKIVDFHNPDAEWLYPIVNAFPDRAPYYASDPDFEHLLPYGTPFFEQKSSIITRIVSINPEFSDKVVELLRDQDWSHYDRARCMQKVASIHTSYRKSNKLIVDTESKDAFLKRVEYEIVESKRVLQERLGKEIRHICWPHGDYTEQCHSLALESGYSSTLFVGRDGSRNTDIHRFERIGAWGSPQRMIRSIAKSMYKIRAFEGRFPYTQAERAYRFIRYGIR